MTWSSLLTRSLALFVILPLILTKFQTSEIGLWYLFTTVISLQLLADMGFSPTFARVLSYAMGGAAPHELYGYSKGPGLRDERPADWESVEAICATMRVVYNRLTFAAMTLLIVLGTAAMQRPISLAVDSTRAWVAWAVVLVGSSVVLRGNFFSAYLQGLNEIALVRRWEALSNVGAIITSFVVLILGGRLLALVIAHQSWMVINIGRNWMLCRTVADGRFRAFQRRDLRPEVFAAVWPSAWRSGLGILMAQGPIRFTGILYAQVASPASLAMYLVSLKLITAIKDFSRAPFYSRIPLLARLRAQGRIDEQLAQARRGMVRAHWIYLIGFCTMGISGDSILGMLDSNAAFANPLLWSLLGLGVFSDSFGAMHLHLYSTTNHIIWHIANGVSGAVFVLIALILFIRMDVYAFPIAHVISSAAFYVPYTLRHSYRMIGTNFWSFERSIALVPGIGILLYGIAASVKFLLQVPV